MENNTKTRMNAILLAVFLGGFGAHKFYLGDQKKGIIYLVFCWTGIVSLIGLYDAYILYSMDDATFNQTYN